jgi:DNA-binding transcriptional regulator YiaG
MKYRREGTLDEATASLEDFDSRAGIDAWIREQMEAGAIGGLDDFIAKAEKLGAEMMSMPVETLGHKKGRGLRDEVAWLRRAIEGGADREALYMAICAALSYSKLAREKRDDADESGHARLKKFTRKEYFAARSAHAKREDLAAALGVTLQGLRKWEEANLE